MTAEFTNREVFVAAKRHLRSVDAGTVTDLQAIKDRMSQPSGRKDTAACLTSLDKQQNSRIVKGFEDNAAQSVLAFAAHRLSVPAENFDWNWTCRR